LFHPRFMRFPRKIRPTEGGHQLLQIEVRLENWARRRMREKNAQRFGPTFAASAGT
jgi:hypothetical protein